MTVIINSAWGGRVCQLVDRQISQRRVDGSYAVVDEQSNKICIVQTSNAIFSLAYTGVAVAHQSWLDCVIANCLAHRQLSFSLVQPGSSYLARPMHIVLDELQLNLNGQLNTDRRTRIENLRISVVGWHLGSRLIPFFWELYRGEKQSNGNRYFEIKKERVGKFLREFPKGFFADFLGDAGTLIEERLNQLQSVNSWLHDDVERHIRQAILDRSKETRTVSGDCIAVQVDPRDWDGHIQVTYYPAAHLDGGYPLISPWVLTPRMICAPSETSSAFSQRSECGTYLLGGFSDGNTNLHVRTRIPYEHAQAARSVMSFKFQSRADVV